MRQVPPRKPPPRGAGARLTTRRQGTDNTCPPLGFLGAEVLGRDGPAVHTREKMILSAVKREASIWELTLKGSLSLPQNDVSS